MSNVTTRSLPTKKWLSEVKIPQGLMLVKTIHDSYGTLHEMILELTQNAIDADARRITISINKKTRCVTITDDGDGVSKEKYELALQSVMRTMKTRDKLGQFGMGMLSPLAKCEWHTLTSCPKDGTWYMEWKFESEAIREQTDNVFVPYSIRNDLRHKSDPRGIPKGVTPVTWRTLVEIHNYTTDRYISRIPTAQVLFDDIVQNYREKMLENGIRVSITITPEKGEADRKEGLAEPYFGTRLPDVIIQDEFAGNTRFHLHLARKNEKGKYIGQGVSVGEADNAFRFTFKNFARSVSGVLSSSIVEALNSGVFEGDILTERTKLHSNRKSFEQGDALLGFCETIEAWFEQVGRQHYEDAVDSHSEERYKALGEDLKKTLEGFLRDPRFENILKPLNNDLGLTAEHPHKDGDVDPNKKGETSKSGSTSGGRSTPDSPGERKPRAKVKSEPIGLEFRYEDIYDERRLWVYTPGVLTFNILHSKWRECEKSQRSLKQLQELIGIKVIMLQLMPDEWRAFAESFAEELVDPVIYLLQNSPNFQHLSRKGKKEAE